MGKSHSERWEDIFKPRINHLDKNAARDESYRYETFGAELDYVLSVANSEPNKVWTMVEGDNGKWYIVQGYHLVNRVAYIITEVPFDPANPKHERYATRGVLYA